MWYATLRLSGPAIRKMTSQGSALFVSTTARTSSGTCAGLPEALSYQHHRHHGAACTYKHVLYQCMARVGRVTLERHWDALKIGEFSPESSPET